MTDEDQKRIAEYMGWCLHENWDNSGEPFDTGACLNCGASIFNAITRNFDLNDAELVVNELARNGEWREFYESCFPLFVATNPLTISPGFLNLWLFNADNFFKVFVEWRKRNEQS